MNRRDFISFSAAAMLPAGARAGTLPMLLGGSAPGPEASIPFSLDDIPFSTAGSFLTINPASESGVKRLRLQTVRKTAATYRYQTGAWSHEIFEFQLVRDGTAVAYEVSATPLVIRLRATGCEGTIEFLSPEELQLTVHGGAMRLQSLRAFSWRVPLSVKEVRGFDFGSGYTSTLTARDGSQVALESSGGIDAMLLSAASQQGFASGTLRAHVEREEDAAAAAIPRPLPTLAEWMRLCPADPTAATQAATRTGWYLFWNLRVEPSGGYTRPTVLSSKRSLSEIWSWDNLFTALAMVRVDAQLAWDQLGVILDHQLPNGTLPDTVSDAGATYGFHKPPVWGWAAARLAAATPKSMRHGRLGAAYSKMAAFHRWWFQERDLRGDGVPFYLSGNDSGWDNSTVFASGNPVQSPDLLALLCLDAERLGMCASALGLSAEAAAWNRESDRLLTLFHRHFVRDDELITHELTSTGTVEHRSTSLLTRIPILLGPRLATPVRLRIIADLRDPRHFLAPSGPSSESLSSPLYEPNGYWRGPVWGPSTVLICDGLARSGEGALAADLAARYRMTVARKADFHENYDAVSGAGQYDSGMTWASASYLLLAEFVARS